MNSGVLRRIRAMARVLGLMAVAIPAAAQYSAVSGDGTCPAGTRIVEYEHALANNWAICQTMKGWDIARIGGKGSISGSGYNCKVIASDPRALGATVCQPLPPDHKVQVGRCTQARCGIVERRGGGDRAASGPVHNCSGLITAVLKQQCEARNIAAPEAQRACKQPWGGSDGTAYKGYASCLSAKLPPLPDSLKFTRFEADRCAADLRTHCRKVTRPVVDFLFPPPGGSFYEECSQEVRPAHCEPQIRLYQLCGMFEDAFYREECLIRARK